MRAIVARAEALARVAQRTRVAALAREWGEMLPGASVSTRGSEVIISARGLAKRWLADNSLRFIGRGGR